MYCGKAGHVTANCNLGSCPGTTGRPANQVRNMEPLNEEDEDLEDKQSTKGPVEVNKFTEDSFHSFMTPLEGKDPYEDTVDFSVASPIFKSEEV